MKILVINGVNLNMLGKREPNIYGSETLEGMNEKLKQYCSMLKVEAEFNSSNIEGEIVEMLHAAMSGEFSGVVINAGAYTHYSYAIADALKMLTCPKIEVHISNVAAREEFRRNSVLAPYCTGVISGFGIDSYRLAIAQIASLNKIKS